MLNYYVDAVRDEGELFRIRAVFAGSEMLPGNRSHCIGVDREVYLKIRNLLAENKAVYVNGNAEIMLANLQVKDAHPLEKDIREVYLEVIKHYEIILDRVGVFELYNCMLINNELAARGYFITPNNKEEVYIDIINSNDENLQLKIKEKTSQINKLSDLLEKLF